MTIALTQPWTIDQFLTWAGAQEGRYEFDGHRPVAIAGSTADHNRIMANIHAALRPRLRGTPCAYYGPDLGVSTGRQTVRYPDALITCTKFSGADRLAPHPVVVFEVLSADSGRRDRIEKVRDYAATPSILRYVMVESAGSGLLVLYRQGGADPWMTLALTADDSLVLPEVSIEVPVAAFYDDVIFAG